MICSQDPNGGNGGIASCAPDQYCVCTSGSLSGNYMFATGSEPCNWTTMPTDTWTGSSCVGTSTTAASHTGQFMFTQTLLPITGDGTNWDIIGCTSTYVTPIPPAGQLATYCVDSTPISTQVVTPTLITPTGKSLASIFLDPLLLCTRLFPPPDPLVIRPIKTIEIVVHTTRWNFLSTHR